MPLTEKKQKRKDDNQEGSSKKAKVEKKDKKPVEKDVHITTKPFPKDLKCYKALTENWQYMTEVQAKTLPDLLAKKDVEAQSKTGSGKTLAFVIPAVEYAIANADSNDVVAVILTCVRELALQTVEVAEKLLKYHNTVKVHMVHSGRTINQQKTALADKKHILIATPKRLAELIEEKIVSFKDLKFYVLDEADRLLDADNVAEVRALEKYVPRNCQRALFTATITDDVKSLGGLRADATVVSTLKAGECSTNRQCVVQYAAVTPETFLGTLLAVLKKVQDKRSSVLVFFETVKSVLYFKEWANKNGINAIDFSANSGNKRDKLFTNFRDEGGIMFASDVVARGADFPLVNLVVQVGVAQNTDTFIHRIGRTGRMGAEGKALCILLPCQMGLISDIKKAKGIDASKKEIAPVPVAQTPASVDLKLRKKAFRGFLAYINSNRSLRLALYVKVTPESIEELRSIATNIMGLEEPKCIDFRLSKRGGIIPEAIKNEFGMDEADLPPLPEENVQTEKEKEPKKKIKNQKKKVKKYKRKDKKAGKKEPNKKKAKTA